MRCLRVKSKTTKTMSQTIRANPASGIVNITNRPREGVLADIDTDYGNCVVEIVGHSVLLVFGAPCQLRSLTGQEHGRTIPLPDIRR